MARAGTVGLRFAAAAFVLAATAIAIVEPMEKWVITSAPPVLAATLIPARSIPKPTPTRRAPSATIVR